MSLIPLEKCNLDDVGGFGPEPNLDKSKREYNSSKRMLDYEDNRSVDELVDSADAHISDYEELIEAHVKYSEKLEQRVEELSIIALRFLRDNGAFLIHVNSKESSILEKWCCENTIGNYDFYNIGDLWCVVQFDDEQDRVYFKLKFG